MPSPDPRILCLEPSGIATAVSISKHLDAPLILRTGLETEWRHEIRADFAGTLRECFAAGYPVIGVCAAGILIRSLAPLIRSKRQEPPVVCVAEDGSSVIPLLGGHSGGNELARRIAGAISAHAAITTASELRLGVALDHPPEGWRLENPGDAKGIVAAMLAGKPARVSGRAAWLDPLESQANVKISDAPGTNAPIVLQVAGVGCLTYRQVNLVLGVGSVRNCPEDELVGHAKSVLAHEGLSAHAVEAVYSVDAKSNEAAVHALARNLGVEARFFSPDRLERETERLANPSKTVFREIGCHGVCEAAALAAAGPQGRLLVAKQKSVNSTCAVAEIGNPRGDRGSSRGRLFLVGLGPGRPEYRTLEAMRLLAEADDLVGYRNYIGMVGQLVHGKVIHDFDIGEERERCRFALERAGEGRTVALVCSGDSGIYAMGSLVMELLSVGDGPGGVSAAARRAAVVSTAGITAMQAASARAGAMLGHDFCAISLSDLLTPRDEIVDRIRAAAKGDFVIAFYNPVSRKRRQLIEEARRILLGSRPPETPVVIGRNLGRDDEQLALIRLDALRADDLDMMTVVLVGSSNSSAFSAGDCSAGAGGWHVYTPRGYNSREGKAE